jgi:hypothetical protein
LIPFKANTSALAHQTMVPDFETMAAGKSKTKTRVKERIHDAQSASAHVGGGK